jgi:hypothetical protein
MRNAIIGLVSLSALALPGAALAEEGGAAAGAVTGAITGGIVGGPVGAAVGAGVGGLAGGAATGPSRRGDTVVVVPDRPVATGSVGGCATTTTRTENAYGESKTVTKESCD